MSFAEAKEQRVVWVVYDHATGAVHSVRYQALSAEELPDADSGLSVLETSLSLKAIKQAHQLVIRQGRVQVRGSLTRRR
jgi:hypothetical protein